MALHREGDFFGGGLPEPPTTALGDSARRFPGMGNFPRNRTAGSRHDQPQESKGIIADGLISSACSRIERTSQARAEPRPAALAVNSFDPWRQRREIVVIGRRGRSVRALTPSYRDFLATSANRASVSSRGEDGPIVLIRFASCTNKSLVPRIALIQWLVFALQAAAASQNRSLTTNLLCLDIFIPSSWSHRSNVNRSTDRECSSLFHQRRSRLDVPSCLHVCALSI